MVFSKKAQPNLYVRFIFGASELRVTFTYFISFIVNLDGIVLYKHTSVMLSAEKKIDTNNSIRDIVMDKYENNHIIFNMVRIRRQTSIRVFNKKVIYKN